jgi:hypothetical protein
MDAILKGFRSLFDVGGNIYGYKHDHVIQKTPSINERTLQIHQALVQDSNVAFQQTKNTSK